MAYPSEEKNKEVLDVSVVICTKNAADTILECLKSVKENNPKEIILVDAHSSDKTQEIAKPFVSKIVEDPGRGLAVARNCGLENATGKYIFYAGPDNIMPIGSIKACIDFLEKGGYVGVSTQTYMKNSEGSYLSNIINLYKKARFFPGTRQVIGTPQLFVSDVLRKLKFDNRMTCSDDTDLCYRLSKLNLKLAIADTFVYEVGTESTNSIKRRWKVYGLSDFEYYKKYSKDWSLKRKILSYLHPLRVELLEVILSNKLRFPEKVKILPFLISITSLRYFYWLKFALKNK